MDRWSARSYRGRSSFRSPSGNGRRLLHFLDPQIAKFDALAMALQTDAAGRSSQARMLTGDFGVLEATIQIGVDDFLVVEDHNNLAIERPDLQSVPLAGRLSRTLGRRHHVVDGAGV